MEQVRLGYDKKVIVDHTFIDRDTFWLSIYPQGSDPWKELRKHFFSASNFGCGTGKGLKFPTPKTPEDVANVMKGLKIEDENEAMRMGTKYEDHVRKLYMEFNKVNVTQVGLAVPKFNPKISASSDGLVGEDGCIEIKCPKTMYRNYYWFSLDTMYKTHYDQIQGNMAIYNRKWCDYIIYGWSEDTYFEKRIYFDRKYWEEELLPQLNIFLNTYFKEN